jgi:hypothetical protein
MFLEDFKGLFAQLLQQNNLILNILTTFLNKPHLTAQDFENSSMESKRPPKTQR